MKPISTKFEERIQKNADRQVQDGVTTLILEAKDHKVMVSNRILRNLKWALEKYQNTTLC